MFYVSNNNNWQDKYISYSQVMKNNIRLISSEVKIVEGPIELSRHQSLLHIAVAF